MLIIVHEIMGITAISCKSLKGHGTLLCNQHHTLKRLVFDIKRKVGIVGILSDLHRVTVDKASRQLSDSGGYAVSFVSVRGFIDEFGLFIKYYLATMDSGNNYTLFQLSEATILKLMDVINVVVAEQNEKYIYIDPAPGALPHHIFRILPRNFFVYLQIRRRCIDCTFSIE